MLKILTRRFTSAAIGSFLLLIWSLVAAPSASAVTPGSSFTSGGMICHTEVIAIYDPELDDAMVTCSGRQNGSWQAYARCNYSPFYYNGGYVSNYDGKTHWSRVVLNCWAGVADITIRWA